MRYCRQRDEELAECLIQDLVAHYLNYCSYSMVRTGRHDFAHSKLPTDAILKLNRTINSIAKQVLSSFFKIYLHNDQFGGYCGSSRQIFTATLFTRAIVVYVGIGSLTKSRGRAHSGVGNVTGKKNWGIIAITSVWRSTTEGFPIASRTPTKAAPGLIDSSPSYGGRAIKNKHIAFQ